MNGEQQKERRTAVARIDGTIKDITDLLAAEIETRVKENTRLEGLMAPLIDGETQFRKKAIREAEFKLNSRIYALEQALHNFAGMVWWKRLGWVILGPRFMLWALS